MIDGPIIEHPQKQEQIKYRQWPDKRCVAPGMLIMPEKKNKERNKTNQTNRFQIHSSK
jgi:hypothetical protein